MTFSLVLLLLLASFLLKMSSCLLGLVVSFRCLVRSRGVRFSGRFLGLGQSVFSSALVVSLHVLWFCLCSVVVFVAAVIQHM